MQVPKLALTDNLLLKKIEHAFPLVEMPADSELVFHDSSCITCKYLREDLERIKSSKVSGDVIRSIHQTLYHFSAKSWNWILPYYLRYCLTPEAKHNRMETEYLIYNLRPALEFQLKTLQRLALLNNEQLSCLIYFLEWCQGQNHWEEFYSEDIKKAIIFLQSILN